MKVNVDLLVGIEIGVLLTTIWVGICKAWGEIIKKKIKKKYEKK